MSQKITLVTLVSSLMVKPKLQRGQGANPMVDFYEGGPDNGGNVAPHDLVPPKGQQTPKYDKQHKSQMKHDD